jgi:GNAT superfamily N-acetyltransferase
MIRTATEHDMERLIEMGERFIAETPYRDLTSAKPERMMETLIQTMTTGVVLVSEAQGAITGMIGVVAYDHPYSGELTGFDAFWWVEPEHRGHGVRLMRAAETWARDQGAVKMQMVAPSPRVELLYQRLGYTAIETAYQRSL